MVHIISRAMYITIKNGGKVMYPEEIIRDGDQRQWWLFSDGLHCSGIVKSKDGIL